MRVDCALLCDAATTREGLLHILGGGITRLGRPAFPAPLGVALAVRLELDLEEAHEVHNLVALLMSDDGQVGKVDVEFGMQPVPKDRLEPLAASLALPLHPVSVPRPGIYSFEIEVDGVHLASVAFLVEQLDLGGEAV